MDRDGEQQHLIHIEGMASIKDEIRRRAKKMGSFEGKAKRRHWTFSSGWMGQGHRSKQLNEDTRERRRTGVDVKRYEREGGNGKSKTTQNGMHQTQRHSNRTGSNSLELSFSRACVYGVCHA